MAQNQLSLPLVDDLNRSSLPEARLLYEAQAPGFFALLTKPSPAELERDGQVYGKVRPRQSSYRIEHLPLVLERLDPSRDSFLSQAQFFRPTRRVIHLWHINLCFVDLDVYKSALAGEDLSHIVQVLRRYCGDEGVPLPSVIISSGRGLYAKWMLERPLPQAALPRWNAVQEALLEKFAPFHADWKARSASQVLRLVQTVNTKSGERVRVLHVEEVDGEPLRYDFERLADVVLPWTRQELEALRTRRALKKAGQQELRLLRGGREGPARFSARGLAWARLQDLRTLQRLRGGMVKEGLREVTLFWSLLFMLASGVTTPRQMFHEARALARELNPDFVWNRDWRDSDLSTLYRRAQYEMAHPGDRTAGLYWVTSQRLIEIFQVTPDEERQLKTIVSRDEKRRRNAAQHREARRPGVEARTQARADRDQAIRREAAEGVSQRAIAARHGVSQAHVNRILAATSMCLPFCAYFLSGFAGSGLFCVAIYSL